MAKSNENYVKPLVITVEDEKGNPTKYTLEFDRDTVRLAERNGFKLDELSQFPMLRIPEFWNYAFRMHHPRLTRKETDKLLFDAEYGFGGLGNIPEGVMERLGELYVAPFNTLSEPSKNSKLTVEL